MDLSSVTRWFKKFYSGCKNLDDHGFLDCDPSYRSRSSESHSKNVRWAWHLTIQWGLSPSWFQQKHPRLPNCASCYQNIAKLLILQVFFIHFSGSYFSRFSFPNIKEYFCTLKKKQESICLRYILTEKILQKNMKTIFLVLLLLLSYQRKK